MNDARLEYYANIFVNRKVYQVWGVPFGEFLNYIRSGRWKVLADQSILIVY